MLLAGTLNRKRKYESSIKIPKKLKIQRTQTQKDEIKDNKKQMIFEIVKSIVEKTIKSAKERQRDRQKEMDKKLKRTLSGKQSRKRKYEISIKILKKLKLRKTLTQKSELRALTGPSPDQKGDTPSSEYGASAL